MPEYDRCVSATHLHVVFTCNPLLNINVEGRNGDTRGCGCRAAFLQFPHTRGHARAARGCRALALA